MCLRRGALPRLRNAAARDRLPLHHVPETHGSAVGVGAYYVGLGTFDDPKWLKVTRFGWYRSAHPWVQPPEGVEVFETSSLPPPTRP